MDCHLVFTAFHGESEALRSFAAAAPGANRNSASPCAPEAAHANIAVRLRTLTLLLCVLAAAASCLAQDDALRASAPNEALPAAAPQPASVARSLFGLGTFGQTLAATVYDQIRHFPAQWGRGTFGGLGKRAASEYGQVTMGNVIQSGVQRLHKEDPRYFRRGEGNFFRRTYHVIENTLVVHSTTGGRTVSLALPAYAYGSWAIAARWYPPDVRGAGGFFLYGSSNVGTKAAGNFFREFWPDVKGLFARR